MDYKTIALECAAILVSYIVLILPVSFATDVNIIFGSSTKTVALNQETLVQKRIGSPSGSGNVTVSITGPVEKAYVYKCRDKNPANCDISNSDSFSGAFEKTYKFADISANSIANMLILVKAAASGTTTWLGFWEPLKIFSSQVYSTGSYADSADFYSRTPNLDFVSDFITNYQSIPFNTSSTAESVSLGASKLFVLKANKEVLESGGFEKVIIDSGNITEIDRDYYFVLANTTTGTKHPVTLFVNPTYHCGYGPGYDYAGGKCETNMGETQDNCCMDCPCSSDFYCDREAGCKREGLIALSLYGAQSTTVRDCRAENKINITARIENSPATASIVSARYTLNYTEYSLSDIIQTTPGVYIFRLTVPPIAGCTGQTYNLGPNTLSATITYQDAVTGEKTKVLGPISFPNIEVRSWTCGNGIAETGLGETSANCCYDVPCSAGQYCDFTVPAQGACRADLTSNDFRIVSATPPTLYTHRTSDTATVYGRVFNKPVSFAFTPGTCSMDCKYGISFDQNCSSTCSVDSCNSLSSSDNIANLSCSLRFSIQNYSSAQPYRLTPTMNINANYNNGSSTRISKTLTGTAPYLTVGANYCGDSVCDSPDETTTNCCYDCGCNAGEYCNTNMTSRYTPGDSCRPLSNIGLSIESANPTTFTNSFVPHNSTLIARLGNYPSGLSITPACSLSSVSCLVSCAQKDMIDAVKRYNCTLFLPAMDYNNSPLFNPATKLITIPPGNLTFGLRFNNGTAQSEIQRAATLPAFQITPVYQCGDSRCDSQLGETAANCCADCSCKTNPAYGQNFFCYTAVNPNGTCTNTSQITLQLQRPESTSCTINLRDECVFTGAITVEGTINNPPSNASIVSAVSEVSGDKASANCAITEIANNTLKTRCSLVAKNFQSGRDDGTISLPIKISMVLSYLQGRTAYTTNLTAQTSLSVAKTQSGEVKGCEAAKQKAERQKNDVDNQKKKLETFFWIAATLTALACVASPVFGWGAPGTAVCWIGIAVTSCVSAFLLTKYDHANKRLEKLEEDRDAMCTSGDMNSLRGSAGSGGMSGFGDNMLTILAWIGCAISTVMAFKAVAAASAAGKTAPVAAGAGTGTGGSSGTVSQLKGPKLTPDQLRIGADLRLRMLSPPGSIWSAPT